VTTALARANARRCFGDCPSLRVARLSLDAKLDALNIEADQAKRRQAIEDREREETARITVARDALRDSVRDDPVTSRLAVSLGVTAASLDLASGLVFAAVLEGVACLFWFLALESSPPARMQTPAHDPVTDADRDAASVAPAVTSEVTSGVVTPGDSLAVSTVTPTSPPVPAGHVSVTQPHSMTVQTVTQAAAAQACQPPTDLEKLLQAIQAGQVRTTVADIRRHLGCSQARAAALRRQLGELNLAA
jgi:hypothetical protein